MENIATSRRPIDSGISEGGISNLDDEDKLDKERLISESSDEEDIVFKDMEDSENNTDMPAVESKKSGAMIAVKERLLATVNQIAFGAKYLGVALVVWLAGFFGFSFLWLVIGVFVMTWREYRRRKKEAISEVLSNIAKDERKYFQAVKDIYKMSGKDLPSWVYFPDVEKAEWLNTVLEQLWPYVSDFVKNIIVEKVEPSICDSNQLLKGFTFSKVDLGEKSPRVSGIKVYGDEQTRRTEIVMDLQIIYESDCNISVTVNKLSAGIKNLSVRGMMRVELRPLISNIPLAGAVSVAFVHQPSIDFDLTDLGNFFDLPGVDSILRNSVSDCVHSMLVLPEKYVLKLCDDVDISKLLHPLPKGVVRIHIIEAKNLEEKDRKILGVGGGSDPYVEVKVGRGHEFRTKVIEHNVNPVWKETFDAIVMDVHSSTIEITLYDDDGALTKADYLGSASVQLKNVYNEGLIDEWIPLSNVKHGTIHVKLEWLDLSDNPRDVRDAMEYAGRHDFNSALLNMYIDSAKDLPLKTCDDTEIPVISDVQRVLLKQANTIHRITEGLIEGKYEPSPIVKIELPGETKRLKTKVAANTNNPVWEQNFRALIQNPRMESLNFNVKSSKNICLGNLLGQVNKSIRRRRTNVCDSEGMKDELLGSVKVRISQLLKAPDMTKEEPFHLLNSGPKSQLQMRLSVRLLMPRKNSNFADSSSKSSAFVIAKSKHSTSGTDDIKSSENDDKSLKDVELTTLSTSASDDFVDSVLGTRSVSEHSESSSTNDLGIDFGNARKPQHNGTRRSDSFTSEISNVFEGNNLKERLNKRDVINNDGEFALGRLNLTLSYSSTKEKLMIDVHKAEKLIVCDEDDKTSDPYVRIYLLPSKKRRKTKVVKNNLNPVFNERIEYEMLKGEIKDHQLDISVKNKTGLLSSEKVLMGRIVVDLAKYNLESPVNEWFPLQVSADDED
uniref:extended synaptotagmin-1-like isoform X3 n=1 Tax=Styela clava TaxID=7725 RepID=UPI00193A6897|nr:extended synaptotagmin-1-like isoform X3 [Styela clava]